MYNYHFFFLLLVVGLVCLFMETFVCLGKHVFISQFILNKKMCAVSLVNFLSICAKIIMDRE